MKGGKKIKNSGIIIIGFLLVTAFIYFVYFQNGQSESISKFITACGVACGKTSSCEGKTVSVSGYLDRNNISAEKFLIQDVFGNLPKANLEVDISGNKNTKENIFNKINNLAKNSEKSITVVGTVIGFDMPINGNCQRGFRLNISDESALK